MTAHKTPNPLESVPAEHGNPLPATGQGRSIPPLSPTEKRVYALLIQRLTERQVAEQLERSHNTVHVHVRNIYRKLGVRSRQELFELHQRSTEQRVEPPASFSGQAARARKPGSVT